MPELNTIGGVGTLAAAGLATAGQYLQAVILDELTGPVGSKLILLVALIGVANLFYRVAILGDYRSGVMLIFGAILFSTAIYPRAISNGVRWEVGSRKHDDVLVRETLRGVYSFAGNSEPGDPKDNPGTPVFKVSWIFAMWDRLTTGLVQVGTESLGVVRSKSDLYFLNRTARYQQLFQMGVVDSNLQQFLQTVLFDSCSRWLGLYQSLVDPSQADRAAEVQLEITRITDLAVMSKVDRNYPFVEELNTRGYFGTPPPALGESLSCKDLWSLAMRALKKVAYSHASEGLTDRLPDGLTPDEMMIQAAIKFGTDDVADPLDMGRMINAIASRMLLGAFREAYPALTAVNRLPALLRPEENASAGEADRYDFSKNVQEQSQQAADASQTEYLGYVMALPYIQGIFLYFLALSYPVFALMLINPNRSLAFVIWLGLWFWVKLWDFGFAAVMRLDDLLYFLLPHGPTIDDAQVNDPGLVLRTVLAADPTYTISVYWDIMAMLIAGIPIVTAMMVWVGGSAVMFELRRSYSGYGTRASGNAQRSDTQKEIIGLQDFRKYRILQTKSLAPSVFPAANTTSRDNSAGVPYQPAVETGGNTGVDPTANQRVGGSDPAIQQQSVGGGTQRQNLNYDPTPSSEQRLIGGGMSDPNLR